MAFSKTEMTPALAAMLRRAYPTGKLREARFDADSYRFARALEERMHAVLPEVGYSVSYEGLIRDGERLHSQSIFRMSR